MGTPTIAGIGVVPPAPTVTDMSVTTVEEPRPVKAVVAVGLPAGGAGTGALAYLIVDWLAHFPWKPVRRPMRFIEDLPEPWGLVALVAAGAVAGLILVGMATYERLKIVVTAETVTLDRGGRFGTFFDGPAPREIAREGIGAVFPDGKKLVLLGRDTRELARESHDLSKAKLRDAFTAHGYPWSDTDPHADQFRPWVEEDPSLPPAAHVVFKARQKALDKGKKDERVALRAELATYGIVVRDEKKRQQWRTSDVSGRP
jgi:hypothetical protein